jgi:RNA polymerase sigma-70 factor (ECF subfamily)
LDPSAISSEEASLVRETLAGDDQAFDRLVRAHSQRVFRFLYQLTRHREDAEDLAQQTFVKAYRHLHRFDVERPLIQWLLTIARRTALNHFRAARKTEPYVEEAASSEPSPAERAAHRDQSEGLWDLARALLAPRDLTVMWLRFGEDLSTEETARVAGLTRTHVKVIVFRARRALLKGAKKP